MRDVARMLLKRPTPAYREVSPVDFRNLVSTSFLWWPY